MGCGFTNRTELELRLNEFVNCMVIRQIRDSLYTEQIRFAYNNENSSRLTEQLVNYFSCSLTKLRNPYQSDIQNIQNDVRSRSKRDLIQIAFCLLFLTQSNADSLKTNFILLSEIFRAELDNPRIDIDYVKSVLRFYFSFISAGVLKAYRNRSPSLFSKELLQVQELEEYYSDRVIDAYIMRFTEKHYTRNFSFDKFISEKIDYFNHEVVRDELKHFYLENHLLFRQKIKPAEPLVSSGSRPVHKRSSSDIPQPQNIVNPADNKYYSRPELYGNPRFNNPSENNPVNSVLSQANQAQFRNLVSSGVPPRVNPKTYRIPSDTQGNLNESFSSFLKPYITPSNTNDTPRNSNTSRNVINNISNSIPSSTNDALSRIPNISNSIPSSTNDALSRVPNISNSIPSSTYDALSRIPNISNSIPSSTYDALSRIPNNLNIKPANYYRDF